MSRGLDINQLAKRLVDQATGEVPKTKLATPKQRAGQKGGLVGGKKRMESLTDEQRAKLAASGVSARKKAPGDQAGAFAVKKWSGDGQVWRSRSHRHIVVRDPVDGHYPEYFWRDLVERVQQIVP